MMFVFQTMLRLDNAHIFLIQLIGTILISLGAVRLCSEGTDDNSVHSSLFFSRFLVSLSTYLVHWPTWSFGRHN